MWKLVRNLLLAGAVLAGGGMLALWAVAQQQATDLAQRLAPWGTLAWSGAGADLAGVLTLSQVRFVPKAGLGMGSVEARELRLRTPGAAWLAWRAVSRDTSAPSMLGVGLVGARLPAITSLEGGPAWFGRTSMVPFEALGCGGLDSFAAAQYQAMAITPKLPDVDVDYRYDEADKSLAVSLATSNPGFATLKAQAQLKSFSPAALEQKAARDAVRVAQATFDYRDAGYFARRNAYCAKQAGVTPEAFVEQHLAAVQEFLKTRRVVPAEGVIALYRKLLEHGGAVQLLSLPNANLAPTQYAAYDPEEVLRSLNLTARHNDSPPQLFKLFFLAPEPTQALAGADANTAGDPPDATVATPTAASGSATTSAVTAAAAPTPAPAAPIPAPAATVPAPTATAPAKPAAQTPIAAAAEPAPSLPPASTKAVPPKRPSSVPLFAPKPVRPTVQEPVAAAPPAPATVPTLRVSPPPEDPRVAGRASAPAPPPGSTAALVWQGPGVDRLDTENRPEPERRFMVVAYENLGGHVGARVALITTGGKEIEGRVASVDGAGVMLNVQRDTGQAQFFVERARILEIRLQRPVRG